MSLDYDNYNLTILLLFTSKQIRLSYLFIPNTEVMLIDYVIVNYYVIVVNIRAYMVRTMSGLFRIYL